MRALKNAHGRTVRREKTRQHAKKMEFSIRSAQTAVYSLLSLHRTPLPVYKGDHPRVLLRTFLTLHDQDVQEAFAF
jgi:myosin-crossreactive antigen